MNISRKRGPKICLILLACLSILTAGCAPTDRVSHTKVSPAGGLESILVIGFQPVLSPGRQPGMVRNPLTAAFRYAEPVPQEVADKLTYRLYDLLSRSTGHHLISPGEAKSALSNTHPPLAPGRELDRYSRIGKSLSAEAVLAGYIWRWREREGSELGVESPASVDFDLYLIRLADKAVVWRYQYDKRQQSLTENLLDLRTFLQAGGKWLTAFELADLGLEKIADSFPKKID